MRRQARLSIAGLRKWRRAISAGLVPAVAWWSLSASACFGLPLVADQQMSVVAHVDHDTSSAHAAHGMANDMHEHAGMPDCAHCPATTGDGQSTPTICITDGTSNTSGLKTSAAPDFFKLVAHSRLPTLTWNAAPPPLIRTAAPSDVRRFEHTPLNIRHCVFLI